jgi:methylated-DNA-[protein]-cysteine S-methyltransferase
MTGQYFAIFDSTIGPCGILWGERGITGVQLPMGSEEKTRKRILQRNGDVTEALPTAEMQSAIGGMIELLAGKPNDLLDVELDLDGVPEFNRGVYDIARKIPPG